ncbi:hypothetical protein NW765_016507 [Fusarium oxysporum]|nr:hypothetical protein NW765_016507 [Fusarium oxysporum]
MPSLRLESKHRLAACIFTINKVMVSFTGRPPLIGRRYFSTPSPSRYSRRGFTGRSGDYKPCEKNVQITVIKDELLEFALKDSSKATLESLSEIKARAERIVAKFLQSLIYHPEDPNSPDFKVDIIYSRILIWLEHLQNLFFAERLLLRLRHSDQSRLLIISFEMVTLTLIFWTQQDRFAEVRRDFEWLLMAYAAPGGGILCLELLRPTFHGIHPDCAELSRSTIIQKLSLLIGFLNWVRPPAPNADLYADYKAVIQGVLDHNLNAPLVGGGALETLD